MLAVRLHEGDRALHFDEIEIPVAKSDDEVVIKVSSCGVCFSDIHVANGEFGEKPRPMTLGHEVTGWTEEHGNVFVYTPWGCGNCRFCAAGTEMICPDSHEAGLFDQGGYAEYMLVPHRRYIFPLGDLDPIDSAPLGCGGLTAFRAVRHALPFLGKGKRVLVLGAGGLGQYAVQYLSLLSDAEVHVGDPDPAKCATAKELGATEAANPADLEGPYAAVLDFDHPPPRGRYDFIATFRRDPPHRQVVGENTGSVQPEINWPGIHRHHPADQGLRAGQITNLPPRIHPQPKKIRRQRLKAAQPAKQRPGPRRL